MDSPDWKADAQTLFQQALLAIEEYATAHREEVCSFFAFGVNYYEGWISINLDTLSNSIKRARGRAFRIRQSQQAILARETGWQDARSYLTRDRMCTVNTEIGYFQHYLYKELRFDHWADYFASLGEGEDHSGHVLVLITEVIHKLVTQNPFSNLSISSPFHIGVQFIDDDLGMLIMDIINWA